MRTGRWLLVLFPLALGLALASSPASAETVKCTAVTAVPAVISTPGIYCLTQSLTAPGGNGAGGITISADDVVLDLNGWTLSLDTAACGQQSCAFSGIVLQGHRVTVRNGAIRGFAMGILQQSSGSPPAAARNVLEGLRISKSVFGIFIATGGGDIIRDNFVHNTTGEAIFVTPASVRLVNNDVEDVQSSDDGAAVRISGGIAINNRITHVDGSKSGTFGIFCNGGGKIRDNVVSDLSGPGTTTRYSTDCNDIGNNH
jgi:hypothetical protein